MNKLLLTGCLILCALNCFSTCIAIYVAKNGRIYVAADSRRTFYFSDKYKAESICKIHNVGNNYFAVAGIDDGGLLKAANNGLRQTANIDSAIGIFKTVMISRYTYLMNTARKYYPDKFRHFLIDGLGSVSFFGYYHGEPYITNIDFLVYLDEKNHLRVTYREQQVATIKVIGISEDIANATPEELPTEDVMQKNPELYVESLVRIEAKRKPKSVSEPIDLLELSPEGAKWIRRSENSAAY